VSGESFAASRTAEPYGHDRSEEARMAGIFVVGFVGKAIGFIILLVVLAVIGLITLLKKAV
jgi:hypothetical protein